MNKSAPHSVDAGVAQSSPTPDFYIPATVSIVQSWPRILKCGDTFAMFDHFGDILHSEHNPGGIFHKDTRHLSGFYMLIDKYRPLILSSTVQDDNAVLTVDLANPDIYRGEALVMSRETLHIKRTKFLWGDACYERIAVRNFDSKVHNIRLAIRFAADFADLFEARGVTRHKHGHLSVSRQDDCSVKYNYRGLDGVERETRLHFDPRPSSLHNHEAVFDLVLSPNEEWSGFVSVAFTEAFVGGRLKFGSGLRAACRTMRVRAKRAAVLGTSNDVLNQALCRSIADIYMLVTDLPTGPYPYAGIPWFSTPFGRDAIVTALQMLWMDPSLALGVLKFLASTQATSFDPKSDAEPGKILHEMRQGEMAATGEIPFGRYYGSVDATPLFVLLAGRYFERTGDIATIRSIWPNIQAALHWVDESGDQDHDGFVEYERKSAEGLGNQGWKDSNDSVMHADGTLAHGPIALVEVQAYVYAAKRYAAKLARAIGDTQASQKYENAAKKLRERFERTFWCEDLGTYALALDGDKKPCRVVASNAGHALFAGIVKPERAARVAARLMARDSYSGWGVRTLASCEQRYNPMSYHNGSIWPHDNALIALGMAHYGFHAQAATIFAGLFDALHYMELMRLPELFCGFARHNGMAPTLYPVACLPQAWASATPFSMLEACLGLSCNFGRREIRFDRPMLPVFIEELYIRHLRLDNAEVDLHLQRRVDDVGIAVLSRKGDVRIVASK